MLRTLHKKEKGARAAHATPAPSLLDCRAFIESRLGGRLFIIGQVEDGVDALWIVVFDLPCPMDVAGEVDRLGLAIGGPVVVAAVVFVHVSPRRDIRSHRS